MAFSIAVTALSGSMVSSSASSRKANKKMTASASGSGRASSRNTIWTVRKGDRRCAGCLRRSAPAPPSRPALSRRGHAPWRLLVHPVRQACLPTVGERSCRPGLGRVEPRIPAARPRPWRGGGWPETFQDVVDGIDHLAELAPRVASLLDLQVVALVGHSAGGQLALWAAGRATTAEQGCRPPDSVSPVAVLALSPVTHLDQAGRVAVALLGGSRPQVPHRWAVADPVSAAPVRVPVLIVHPSADRTVPVTTSRAYRDVANNGDGDVTLVETLDVRHPDPIDPASASWSRRPSGWRPCVAERHQEGTQKCELDAAADKPVRDLRCLRPPVGPQRAGTGTGRPSSGSTARRPAQVHLGRHVQGERRTTGIEPPCGRRAVHGL